MKGTMQISKLKKKAAYYYVKDYDEKYGSDFIFYIEPLWGEDNDSFYFAQKLENGKIKITGEGYIIEERYLEHYKKMTIEAIKGSKIAYYWLDENGEVMEKTYY